MTELIQRLRKAGCMGFAVINNGNGKYLCLAVDRHGHIGDPRTWDYHDTPEAAIASLLEGLRVADPTYMPTTGEALRHPKEFVEGMIEEPPVIHHVLPEHLRPKKQV